MICVGRSNYFRFNHPEEAELMKTILPNARISSVPLQFAPTEPPGNTDIIYCYYYINLARWFWIVKKRRKKTTKYDLGSDVISCFNISVRVGHHFLNVSIGQVLFYFLL